MAFLPVGGRCRNWPRSFPGWAPTRLYARPEKTVSRSLLLLLLLHYYYFFVAIFIIVLGAELRRTSQ